MKRVLLLFVITAFSLGAVAQDPDDRGDKKKKMAEMFWLYGGPSYSKISGDDWKLGAYGGILFQMMGMGAMGSLWLGPEYACQGAAWSYGDTKRNLSYLYLPIIYMHRLRNGLYLEGGLKPGLLLSAEDKSSTMETDIKNTMNDFELGIPLGVGYQSKSTWGVGLRVVPGITGIYKSSGDAHRNFSVGGQFNLRF